VGHVTKHHELEARTAASVDRLFDKGLISFEDDGAVIVSPTLDRSVLVSWSLDQVKTVGAFKPEQSAYLHYHRTEVFKR